MIDKPESLINFVSDRPGHDRRYALDSTKLENWAGHIVIIISIWICKELSIAIYVNLKIKQWRFESHELSRKWILMISITPERFRFCPWLRAFRLPSELMFYSLDFLISNKTAFKSVEYFVDVKFPQPQDKQTRFPKNNFLVRKRVE